MGKLTAGKVRGLTVPGRYGDGGTLHLVVSPRGTKNWVQRLTIDSRHETARKVRRRIGTVMKWAVAQGHRQDNPAGEAITAALPKLPNHVRHMPALPHGEVAAAIRAVHGSRAWFGTKLAFEFLVLTAARSGEVRLATWDEIDLAAAVWTVPADRMKAQREHRVPLCRRAVALLNDAKSLSDGADLVFPSARGKPLSDMTLSKLLKEQRIAAVPHGFRSSFRDWASSGRTTRARSAKRRSRTS